MKKNTYRNNVNYFNVSDGWRLVGAGMLIAGLLLLWLGWGLLSWILMLLFVPSGLALFLVISAIRSSEGDLDAEIAKRMEDLVFRPEEDPELSRLVLKNQAPFTAEAYVLREGLPLRRDKLGRVRSSEYSRAQIFLLSDRLYVLHRVISLVEDKTTQAVHSVRYDDLEEAAIRRSQETLLYKKSTFRATKTTLELKHSAGTLLLPLNDDVEADSLVERILRLRERAEQGTDRPQGK